MEQLLPQAYQESTVVCSGVLMQPLHACQGAPHPFLMCNLHLWPIRS